MAEYIDVAQARNMTGLRLVLSPGVPGPWSEAAKGIFYVKKFPYVKVRQEVGGPNLALQEWTAQTTAPVAAWNDEPPRSTWIQQLFLAERLAPNPPLIPANIADRVLMFGYCNEICGETGFGWSKRLMFIHATLSNPNANEAARASSLRFGKKYGYAPELGAAAPARTPRLYLPRVSRTAGRFVARRPATQCSIGGDIYSQATTARRTRPTKSWFPVLFVKFH